MIKSCGVLLFRNDPQRQFLLMRHRDRWDLPKGHQDRGETEIDCALRELNEETAINRDDVIVDPNFRFVAEYLVRLREHPEPEPKRLLVFLGTLIRSTEITLTEHIGFQWFDWNPPHTIQSQTIDPLLQQVELYLAGDQAAIS